MPHAGSGKQESGAASHCLYPPSLGYDLRQCRLRVTSGDWQSLIPAQQIQQEAGSLIPMQHVHNVAQCRNRPTLLTTSSSLLDSAFSAASTEGIWRVQFV